MAKKGIRSGASYKAFYTGYKNSNRWQKNKILKLNKRLVENPNDKGAEAALKIASAKVYNRKKPGQKGWYPPQENKLQKEMKSEVETVRKLARAKLDNLNEVYLDKRPSPLRQLPVVPEKGLTIPDQLFLIGLINEKKRVTANTRMGRIYKR